MSAPSNFDRVIREVKFSTTDALREHLTQDLSFARDVIQQFDQKDRDWKMQHLSLIEKVISVAPKDSNVAVLITFISTLEGAERQTHVGRILKDSVRMGNFDLVKVLIEEHNADPNFVDEEGLNVFSHAVKAEQHDILMFLLNSSNTSPGSSTDSEGNSFYHFICSYPQNAEVLELLLNKKFPFSFAENKNGDSPFQRLVENQNTHYAVQFAINSQKQDRDYSFEVKEVFERNPETALAVAAYLRDNILEQLDAVTWFLSKIPEELFEKDEIKPIVEGYFSHVTELSHPLFEACTFRNRKFAQLLLEKGVVVSSDHLATATDYGSTQLAIDLIQHCVDIKEAAKRGASLLVFAVSCGNVEVTRALIQSGQCDIRGREGEEALFSAIDNEKLEIVDLLLTAGVNPNRKNEDGTTLLMCACIKKNPEIALRLLDCNNIEVDAQLIDTTALHYAAQLNLQTVVAKLIAKKANLYIRNMLGDIPAFLTTNADIIREFIQADPKIIYSTNDANETLLEFFSEYVSIPSMIDPDVLQEIEIYRLLNSDFAQNLRQKSVAERQNIIENIKKLHSEKALQSCAYNFLNIAEVEEDLEYVNMACELYDLNIVDGGSTFLNNFLAGFNSTTATKGTKSIINQLITKRLGINHVNSSQETPLILAVKNGNIEAALLLIEQRVNLNHKDSDGNDAIHCAVKNGDLIIVDALCKAGAFLNSRNRMNDTPFSASIRDQRFDIALRLLQEESCDVNRFIVTPPLIALLLSIGADSENEPKIIALIEQLSKKADLNLRTSDGRTALHYVSRYSAKFALDFIELGADLRIKDNDGSIPLVNAANVKNKDIIKAMITKDPGLLSLAVSSEDPTRILDFLFEKVYSVQSFEDKERVLQDLLPDFHPFSRHAFINKMQIDSKEYLQISNDSPDVQRKILKELKLWEDQKTPWYLGALIAAIENDREDFAKMIIDENQLIQDPSFFHNLLGQIEQNPSMQRVIEFLIDQGVNVNSTGLSGDAPLHLVLRAKIPEDLKSRIVRKLISKNANVNAMNQNSQTPLSVALGRKDNDILSVLIEAGADPLPYRNDPYFMDFFKNASNLNTPLIKNLIFEAFFRGYQNKNQFVKDRLSSEDQRKALTELKEKCPLEFENVLNELFYSEFISPPGFGQKDINLLTLLLEMGADANNAIPGDKSFLFIAISGNLPDVARLLIEHGANVNHKNEKEQTVMHYMFSQDVLSLSRNDWEVLFQLLVSNHANVNSVDNQYQTPLNIAIELGELEKARLLIRAGADIFIGDDVMNYDSNDTVKTLVDEMSMPQFIVDYLSEEYQEERSSFLALSADERKAAIKQFSSPEYENFLYNNIIVDAVQSIEDGPEAEEFLLALFDSGLDINKKFDVLFHLFEESQDNLAKALIAKGADINRDLGNGPLLYLALTHNRMDLVQYLLDHGANPFQQMTPSPEIRERKSILSHINSGSYQIIGQFANLCRKGIDFDILSLLLLGNFDGARDLLNTKSVQKREEILSQLKAAYPNFDEIDNFILNYQNEIDLIHYSKGIEDPIPEPSRSCDVNQLMNFLDWVDFTDKGSPYYRNPESLSVMGEGISPNQLRDQLQRLISNIKNRTRVIATGETPQELEEFYSKLEKLLQNIIIACEQKTVDNFDKIFTFLLDFASAGQLCGTAHIDVVKEHFDLLNSKPAATNFEARVNQILARERRSVLENDVMVSFRNPDPESEGNEKHERHQYLSLIGESRGISGVTYEGDAYVYHRGLTKKTAENQFDHVYSAAYIVHRINRAIDTKEIDSDIIDYWLMSSNNIPDDWQRLDWNDIQQAIDGKSEEEQRKILESEPFWIRCPKDKTIEEALASDRQIEFKNSFYDDDGKFRGEKVPEILRLIGVLHER